MVLYRLILALVLPVLAGLALLRGPRGALRERLGHGPAPQDAGPRLWLHGASVGELTSARWVLQGLVAARPGLQVLVTCNTGTARVMVAGWGMPGVQAALAPFDTAAAVGRVLRRWQPAALILVENELWPGRIAAAAAAGVPVLAIGARLSARSAARWARAPGLIRPMLAALTWVSAQDAASRERLASLGLPLAAQGPDLDLKALVARPRRAPLKGPAARAHVLLAASTHEGEETPILEAFAAQRQFSHLILAPRHPERGDDLARRIAARGLTLARRSQGGVPDAAQPVFLADTLGEMDLWYAMAGACLIGGSLVPKGGHTPHEPARHGCALLHGPSTENFAAPFARLDAADAALPVTSATLAAALDSLTPARQADLAVRAAPLLRPADSGDWLVGDLLHRAGL